VRKRSPSESNVTTFSIGPNSLKLGIDAVELEGVAKPEEFDAGEPKGVVGMTPESVVGCSSMGRWA
jgi:hypothetical protein